MSDHTASFNEKLQKFGFIALTCNRKLRLGPQTFDLFGHPGKTIELVIVGHCTKEEFLVQHGQKPQRYFYKAMAE